MKNKKPRIYIDMDGVIVDFEGYMTANNVPVNDIKYKAGHYAAMLPIAGAVEAVRRLIEMGFDVWIATKPPTGNASAYAEKADWIYRYLPELTANIIVTHDKGCLGNQSDFLIDDRPHKANCEGFEGTLIVFNTNNPEEWLRVIAMFDQKDAA